MSWEALSAVASITTAVIIAVTALAALVQLRHLRSANQLTAALALYGEADSPEIQRARTFVTVELAERMEDPAFREELLNGKFDRSVHLEIKVGNYWEKLGVLMRLGLLDRHVFLDWGSEPCLLDWQRLRAVTRALRIEIPDVWRDFEYLARLSAKHIDWEQKHPFQQPSWGEGVEGLHVSAKDLEI